MLSEYSEMVLPPLTFMVDLTMNVRGGSTIYGAPGVPKNFLVIILFFLTLIISRSHNEESNQTKDHTG